MSGTATSADGLAVAAARRDAAALVAATAVADLSGATAVLDAADLRLLSSSLAEMAVHLLRERGMSAVQAASYAGSLHGALAPGARRNSR